MPWQDLVIALANLVMAIAVLPSLVSADKPATKTAILMIAAIIALIVSLASLGLWLSTLFVAINGLLWALLLVQCVRRDRR